ncbi:MAG: hypothetical protein WCS99_03790 [Limisphaerales bacterium]
MIRIDLSQSRDANKRRACLCSQGPDRCLCMFTGVLPVAPQPGHEAALMSDNLIHPDASVILTA